MFEAYIMGVTVDGLFFETSSVHADEAEARDAVSAYIEDAKAFGSTIDESGVKMKP